jgi:hypothetical protein
MMVDQLGVLMSDIIPSVKPRQQRHFRWRYFVISAVAFLMLMVGILPIPIWANRYVMCRICGSSQWQTECEFGVTTGASIQSSALDVWIAKNLGGHTHDWKHMSTVGHNLLGVRVYNACSSAPPVFGMSSILNEYVKRGSANEIGAFVKVMQTGSDAAQQRAVDQAVDEVFRIAPTSNPVSR